MPSPAPQEEAGSLFNDLVRADIDSPEVVARVLLRARALIRILPANFGIRTVLANAYLLSGERGLAENCLDGAFHTRSPEYHGMMLQLARVCLALGDIQKARTIFEELIKHEDHVLSNATLGNAARFAVCVGDPDFLLYINSLKTRNGTNTNYLKAATDAFQREGFLEHLHAHQKIILDIVGKSQLWIGSEFFNEDGMTAIAVLRYISHETNRRQLQRSVSDALFDYYKSRGLPPGFSRRCLVSMFVTLPGQTGEIEAA